MFAESTAGAFLPRLLIPIAFTAVFALSRKYFAPTEADVEVSEDADTYLPNVVLINACMTGIGIGIAFALHALLIAINRAIAAQDGPADIVLYPSAAIWWFLPGFAALCLPWEITLQLWSCFSPSQARAYRSYSTLKSGFDSTRVLRWMGILIVLPIAIATILALPIHTTITPTGVCDGRYASIREEVYPYSQATSLTQFDGYVLRDGSFAPRAGILIRFSDGRTFNTATTDDLKPTVDPKLANLLQTRTGLPLLHAHLQPQ